MTDEFQVYPAIDLRAGRVVRLRQGDPDRQTTYSDRPARVARAWADAGARWIHVVNLDGAFGQAGAANRQALKEILREITAAGPPAVQFGGGLRAIDDVAAALSLGVRRVVLGTAAVEDPDLVARSVDRFGPEAVAAGIDARDGRVTVRGWTADTDQDPVRLGRQLRAAGLTTAIYTDVRRDGMETGPDVEGARRLSEATGLTVIASGGVASRDDIQRLKAAGLGGVIVGRALYEGRFTLEEALRC